MLCDLAECLAPTYYIPQQQRVVCPNLLATSHLPQNPAPYLVL